MMLWSALPRAALKKLLRLKAPRSSHQVAVGKRLQPSVLAEKSWEMWCPAEYVNRASSAERWAPTASMPLESVLQTCCRTVVARTKTCTCLDPVSEQRSYFVKTYPAMCSYNLLDVISGPVCNMFYTISFPAMSFVILSPI